MMPLIGLLLVGAGVVHVVRVARGSAIRGRYKSLEVLRNATIWTFCFSTGTAFLFVGEPLAGGLLFAGLASLCIGLASSRIAIRLSVRAESSVMRALLGVAREHLTQFSVKLRKVGKKLVPEDQPEVHFSFDVLDNLSSVGTTVRIYLGILLLTPLLLAVTFTQAIRSNTEMINQLFTAVIGMNALLVISFLTAVLLGTAGTLLVLRSAGFITFNLRLRRALTVLASWLGYGTALGAFTAALVPVTQMFIPTSTVGGSRADAAVSSVSPSLLIDLPAAGAAGGFAIGVVIASFEITRSARNAFYRRGFPAAIFIALTIILKELSVTPSAIFSEVADVVKSEKPQAEAVCTIEGAADFATTGELDKYQTIMIVDGCSGSMIIGNTPLVWSITVFVAVTAVTLLTRDALNKSSG